MGQTWPIFKVMLILERDRVRRESAELFRSPWIAPEWAYKQLFADGDIDGILALRRQDIEMTARESRREVPR